MEAQNNDINGHLDTPAAPKKTPFQEFWLLFKQNRLAMIGMTIFALFFLT